MCGDWPGIEQTASTCANVSYKAYSVYAEVMTLDVGEHTLYVGMQPKRSQYATGWGKDATIGILGIIPLIYPYFEDDRTTSKYPGCVQLNIGVTKNKECPPGDALWMSVGFRTNTGHGGALVLRNPFNIWIVDSVFRDNSATRGSAIMAVKTESINIRNTTYVTMRAKIENKAACLTRDACCVLWHAVGITLPLYICFKRNSSLS